MVVGAGKYWPTKTSEWCWMPGVGTKPVKEFYAACDIFVYRNKENLSETWGRTVTEAMAAGLPVVAECRGALPEQVDHGVNGFVCETDAEFVKHLSYLVENPDARYEMGLAARTKAIEQFDVLTLRRRTSDIMLQSAVECVDGRVL
jgi:glycosyltransferase involved in cell wall biosynthesis